MIPQKKIRFFMVVTSFGLLFFLISASAPASTRKTAQPPNIVLILADDLGFTDTEPYGGEIPTPNISRLADEGLMFTNYHTAASCTPARAMLLTGAGTTGFGAGLMGGCSTRDRQGTYTPPGLTRLWSLPLPSIFHPISTLTLS